MKKITNNIIRIIALIIHLIFIVYLIKLNILPNIYLGIIIGVILMFDIISCLLISKGKIRPIIGYIILIIISVLSCIGIYYTNVTDNFFNSIGEVKETQIYYVIVKKNSKYNELKDLNNKSMAIFENQSKNYQKVLKEVEKSIKVKDKKYNSISIIVKELLDNKVDSILINSNNKELLDENIINFNENTKIIAKFSIDMIKQKEKEEKEYKENEPFNILISGIDTNGNINKVSRSDVNIIMSVNPRTHEILLTSIQRDMYVQLHGTNGIKDKLTHAGIYGIDMSRQTIEDFLNIDIPYYIRVNFDSVIKLVDTIGGIDIYNDVAFKGGTRYFEQGNIHLNGKQALEYARERKKMPNGDWTRGEHQKVIITAIINKVSSSKELLNNYVDILNNSKDIIQTNIPTDIIKKYVKKQIENMSTWKITSLTVKGDHSDNLETYSMPGVKLYVTIPDEASRKEVESQLDEFIKK